MSRTLFCGVVLALCLEAGGRAAGGYITVTGDPGDGDVGINGLAGSLADPTNRVGVAGNDLHGQAAVFFFALPTLPSRAALVGAELDLQYMGVSQFTVTVTPEFNADLYGIGARSTPTILGSDYYDGPPSGGAGALLADDLITPSTAPGRLSVSGGALLDFVASLYQADGTPTAAYAVFRASPDAHLPPFSSPYRGYELASADNTDGGSFVPQLTLTVVPEPGSLSLLASGVGTLVILRRARGNSLRL